MTTVTKPKLKLFFDAVFYYVNDMERAITFYRDTLGLPMTSRDFVARFDITGVLFEIVPAPHGTQVSGSGNARLCFEVPDIHEAVEELRASGIEVSEFRSEPGGTLVFFRDPDGNELSLWQYDRAA